MDGTPPIRPMSLIDGGTETDQYMIGDALLAAPMFTGETSRTVRLPKGKWHEFATGKLAGENEKITIKPVLNEIPLYVREGSAIPTFKNTTSVAKGISSKAIQVRAYGRLACSGLLYEDDETSFNHEKGDFGMFQLQTSDRELKATHLAGGRATPSAKFEVIRLD